MVHMVHMRECADDMHGYIESGALKIQSLFSSSS